MYSLAVIHREHRSFALCLIKLYPHRYRNRLRCDLERQRKRCACWPQRIIEMQVVILIDSLNSLSIEKSSTLLEHLVDHTLSQFDPVMLNGHLQYAALIWSTQVAPKGHGDRAQSSIFVSQ